MEKGGIPNQIIVSSNLRCRGGVRFMGSYRMYSKDWYQCLEECWNILRTGKKLLRFNSRTREWKIWEGWSRSRRQIWQSFRHLKNCEFWMLIFWFVDYENNGVFSESWWDPWDISQVYVVNCLKAYILKQHILTKEKRTLTFLSFIR